MSGEKYEVGFPSPRAEKEFFKILSKASKKEKERILEWFDRLRDTPRPPGKSFRYLKGEVAIFQLLAHCRIREGNWRILYDIDDSKKRVILLALRRRSHAYD